MFLVPDGLHRNREEGILLLYQVPGFFFFFFGFPIRPVSQSSLSPVFGKLSACLQGHKLAVERQLSEKGACGHKNNPVFISYAYEDRIREV